MKKAFYIYLVIISIFLIVIFFINSNKKNEDFELEGFYYTNNEYLADKKMKIDLFFNKQNISFKEIEKNEYFLVEGENIWKITCRSVDIKEEIVVLGAKFYRYCFEFLISDKIAQSCSLQIKNDLEELEVNLSPIIEVNSLGMYEISNYYYLDGKLLFKGGGALEKVRYLDNVYDVKKINQYYEIEGIKLNVKNVIFDINSIQAFLIFYITNDLDFKKMERISIK